MRSRILERQGRTKWSLIALTFLGSPHLNTGINLAFLSCLGILHFLKIFQTRILMIYEAHQNNALLY